MKCIPCLSKGIKELLKQHVSDELHEMIDEVETCPTGVVMELCPAGVGNEKSTKRKSTGRSEYQAFISQCMKSKPIKGKPFGAASQYMKECAVEWKRVKGSYKNESGNSRGSEPGS